MNRTIVLLALCGLASGSLVIAQDLELVEGAHELALGNIAFPGSAAGTLIFKSCDTCEPQAYPVTSSTSYFAPEGPLMLSEFLTRVAELRERPNGEANTSVTVFRSLATDRVTRIKLNLRDPL